MTHYMKADIVLEGNDFGRPPSQTAVLRGTNDVDIVTVQKTINSMVYKNPAYKNVNATLNDITLSEIPNGAALKVSNVSGVTTYILEGFNTKVDKLMLDGKEYTLDEILSCGGSAGTSLCKEHMQRKGASR